MNKEKENNTENKTEQRLTCAATYLVHTWPGPARPSPAGRCQSSPSSRQNEESRVLAPRVHAPEPPPASTDAGGWLETPCDPHPSIPSHFPLSPWTSSPSSALSLARVRACLRAPTSTTAPRVPPDQSPCPRALRPLLCPRRPMHRQTPPSALPVVFFNHGCRDRRRPSVVFSPSLSS